jgi:small subunit ribosomal protein S16
MALRLRLRKIGKTSKKRLSYRIVACDSKSARDGRFIEEIGFYDPSKNPAVVKIKKDRVDYWLKNGAQADRNVLNIIKKGAQKS